ncbi:CpsD/CapB family tyrosine-protein kinase [soil metagenome]|jgi:Mrp family chromosome partitioning ATPase
MTAGRRPVNASGEARDEAYRSLRSTIKFAAGDARIRTVLIVDTDRDKASDTAQQVALAFANAGDRCAFVDADLRSGAGTTPGLSDVLAGSSTLEAVLKASGTDDGYVAIGPGTVIGPDLLAGDRVSVSLEGLLERFEYVILSTASLPAYSDAISLAARVDASILVVTSGKSRRPRAVEARDALQRVGARVLGVVLIESRRRLFW